MPKSRRKGCPHCGFLDTIKMVNSVDTLAIIVKNSVPGFPPCNISR